ncbi:MAG: DUF1731 domain-containing protein [Micromonosporaceae bacterium]|nr:DUF1731 domain-containing protein [Micromonosporaceae bacterium]
MRLALGGFSAEVLDSHRVLPAVLRETGFQFQHSALDPALQTARFLPPAAGILEANRWMTTTATLRRFRLEEPVVMPRNTQAHLLEYCERLAGSQVTFPFGPTPLVFKVGGKMFALFNGADPKADPRSVSLKCDPEYARVLVKAHPEITPGYHMNKRHWITVDLTAGLPVELIKDLLIDSYDLVVSTLPKARPSGTIPSMVSAASHPTTGLE